MISFSLYFLKWQFNISPVYSAYDVINFSFFLITLLHAACLEGRSFRWYVIMNLLLVHCISKACCGAYAQQTFSNRRGRMRLDMNAAG